MKLSLGKKIILIVILGIFGLSVFFTVSNVLTLKRELTKEFEERISTLGEHLSGAVVEQLSVILSFEDETLVQNMLEPIRTILESAVTKEDIIYVALFYRDEKNMLTRVSRFDVEDLRFPEWKDTRKILSGKYLIRRTTAKNKELLGIQIPVIKDKNILGEIVLGFTDSRIKIIISQTIFKSILISILGVTVLSIAIIVFTNTTVSIPLKEVIRVTKKIAEGNLLQRVEIRTNDEIGQLASAFNKMTGDLQETMVSKDYIDNIIESMSDTLIVVDPNGTIKTVNQAILDLLGYKKAEIIGKTVNTYFVEDTIFRGSNWDKLLKDGSIKNHQMSYQAKSEENIPVSVSASVMRNKKGDLTGLVISARDVRDLNRLQLQLFQSEKMASIGQLAAGVAHELNNPMGVILGFAQSVVKRVKEDDLLYVPLKSIEREAIRCKKLVEDLLTFSRIAKTEVELADINIVIDGVLSLVETKTKITNVEISKDYGMNLPQIMLNKNQIQRVIINLCDNAIDAMPQGGRITISTKLDEDNKFIQVSVSDTGQGIPKEIQQKIFESFFTTKEVGKGTGLGLSMGYEIIRKHNGTIEFESEIGKGTTFTVKLPII